MNLSSGRDILLSTNRSIWVMKIESVIGSPPPTSFDLCCHAARGCFIAAHQIKSLDGFGQNGFFCFVSVQTHGEQWSGIRIVMSVESECSSIDSPCSRLQHLLYDHTHTENYILVSKQERQEKCVVKCALACSHILATIDRQIANLQFKGANRLA
ncbi:hypothetical protein AVEN_134405-1 [Araneus ventricosus]|uniref:Uncharacterized protein n=1 Tax=Araneus ventricosus TaxID=182803 RepID=A0A4Y2X917_ARAVE|nr:hypothetical protein AVEN_233402-1 [Araneus ventricosus]GBO44657.1 hypothetical protein AVEN_134405-1 [Araneus ventricosus]